MWIKRIKKSSSDAVFNLKEASPPLSDICTLLSLSPSLLRRRRCSWSWRWRLVTRSEKTERCPWLSRQKCDCERRTSNNQTCS
ncbi:hypothetical protein CEXT_616201 [Caerostris extrusa]|uniref:Uncharacterized protein n=1 Tax=Caerostris extrusa TaxID=172846 RepID=A0AAV4WDQ8_CAEEX|nr:hypothetical protein CEXT_616201 [Caerostris extrusa]